MLSVPFKPFMLSVIMLRVIMLRVIMLRVIMLSVIMLRVVMLSVVMLTVVAPIIIVHLETSYNLRGLTCHLTMLFFYQRYIYEQE
jgi:hypothetical protein